MAKKKNSHLLTALLVVAVCCIAAGAYVANSIFGRNIASKTGAATILFAIPTGSSASDVFEKLSCEVEIGNMLGLRIAAKALDFDHKIYPGLYKLSDEMSGFDVVRLFRSGKRETVKFTISFARHYEDVLKLAAENLEADYSELVELTDNAAFMDSLGFDKANIICLFLPDTYDFYWNTSARQFLERMAKEYDTFWNETRKNSARSIRLSPQKVMTLASIIDQETRHNDEKPMIAGVYMNRLNGKETAGKLQADPTIKFALNDFAIKRVRKGHIEKAKSSPYSTYEHAGLPPGPICTPSKAGIDAVLRYTHHNYLYFCAQPNYSGYSNFSSTFAQHLRYATEYQRWLTKEGY